MRSIFKIASLAFVISLSISLDSYAQKNEIKFERISIEDGLSQNGVNCILQDSQGFLWFGTGDGLNKYDGNNFLAIYRHDPDKPNTLSNSDIQVLYEDQSGILWIGTREGLNRLVPSDSEGSHLIFMRYKHNPNNPNSLSHDYVTSIFEDSSGMLWIGTRGGLNRLVPSDSEGSPPIFVRYKHNPIDSNSLCNNEVTSILEDQSGKLWIGTRNGLNMLVPSANEYSPPIFTRYLHNPDNPNSLSNSYVQSIYEDRSGILWIGIWGGGLSRFDPDKKTFTHFVNDPLDPQSLSDNGVYSIYEDRSGVLWVGTVGGLNKFDKEKNKFKHWVNEPGNPNSLSSKRVFSIYEDRSGVLWVGTVSGLNRFDREQNNFTYWVNEPSNPDSLSYNYVASIYEDRSGVLWIGTSGGGLNRFDREKGQFMHWVNEPGNHKSLSSNYVRTIYEDRTGNLWIGTDGGGLNRFDQEKGQFTRWIHEPGDPYSLSNDRVRSIYEDQSGVLWIGTFGGGLNRFDRDKEQFTHWANEPGNPISLSSNDILSIYEDRTGNLWIGTWRGGLNRFNRKQETFERYREKDGLPNDVVYGILEDDHGNLWLSTNKGLSKFNPQTETFKNYDINDGLQSNEFNSGAYCKSRSGEMFFGGINGMNAFFPDKLEDNPHIPPIVITALKKFDEVVRTDISDTEEFKFSYKDKYLSFEFAALDYRSPEKNQYAYMLEGFDQDWIYSGTRHFVSYTNLDPGEYIFRVKGSNNDGVWNEEGISVIITITPPFWQTWWFRVFAGFALIGIAFLMHKRRVRDIETQRKKLEVQVAARTKDIAEKNRQLESAFQKLKATQSQLTQSEKMASLGNLAAGVAHEINNPVGAVSSAADTSHRSIARIIKSLEKVRSLEEIRGDKKFQETLNILKSNNDVIMRAGERITKIVQGLRNFARLEEADFQEADIHEELESTLALLRLEIKDRIKIVKEFGEIPKIQCHPNQLNQVFMNILVNASQAIRERGTITIRTSKKDDRIIVSISDDGEGIKEENLKRIYDPGFTTRGVGVGTGLGLSISYRIIKNHGGEIQAKSKVGRGSEFAITLPIKQES